MPLPRPLCTRIPAEMEAELERRFAEQGWSPSEGLRSVIREWLAADRFPWIEFRDTAVGRRAAVRDGPEVWEVVSIAGSGSVDGRVREHFSWVDVRGLDDAIAYAGTFPDEIRAIIERNRRLAGGSGAGRPAGPGGSSGDPGGSGGGSDT